MFTYEAVICYDAQTTTVAKNAAGTIYALDDTAGTTPLQARDVNGLPLTLTTNGDGILPQFQVDGHPQVRWVSGAYSFILTAATAVVEDAKAARVAAENASTTATEAARTASEAAAVAVQRALPPGGTPGQAVVKSGANDFAVGWGDVVRRAGEGPVRLWPAVSTLPPGGSGQEAGDVIFLIGG